MCEAEGRAVLGEAVGRAVGHFAAPPKNTFLKPPLQLEWPLIDLIWKFCKNVASAVIQINHKTAKMAMLVVSFEDLKKLAETSPSGYCASHPPLALQRGFKSRRYRKVGFPDTLFFLVSLYLYIHKKGTTFLGPKRGLDGWPNYTP